MGIKSVYFLTIMVMFGAIVSHKVDGAEPKRLILPDFKFSAYPPSGEIEGKYIDNELITKVYNEIKKIINPDIINIPVNRVDPDSFCSVIKSEEYDDNKTDYCYWPEDICTRKESTDNYDKDFTHCKSDNVWAMTFDDGPNDGSLTSGIGTSQILDQLDAINKKATFFLVGSNIINTPGGTDLVQKIVARGHRIGVHLWSHTPSTALNNKQLIAEFLFTESAIAEATKNQVRPSIWRPPCGDVDDRVRAIASALGYRTIIWTSHPSRDTTDSLIGWKSSDKNIMEVVKNIESWFAPDKKTGFISLQHDVSPSSLAIALQFFEYIKASPPESNVHKSVPISVCNSEIPVESNIRGVAGKSPVIVKIADEYDDNDQKIDDKPGPANSKTQVNMEVPNLKPVKPRQGSGT